MPNKIFNTRIRNKRDTAANWETVASTFQPLDGEMIIVYTADGATRFKVGRYDSVKGRLLYYNELPFTDESLGNKIYTQNEEPVDAADGALWVDLDEISSSPSIIPLPTSADNGKYLGCENGAATWMPVEASGGGATEETWELIDTIPLVKDTVVYEIASFEKYKKIAVTTTTRLIQGTGSGFGWCSFMSGPNIIFRSMINSSFFIGTFSSNVGCVVAMYLGLDKCHSIDVSWKIV